MQKMQERRIPVPPFFEIGPKNYLWGERVLELALAADRLSAVYGVDIIFTAPFLELRRIAERTERLFVFAPHMDPVWPGRGLADILPEGVKAAGACGVMLNHCERPVSLTVLNRSIIRAKETGLCTIVCADSISEAGAAAGLGPDIIVAEPTDLIGTGKTGTVDYVKASIEAVKRVNPEILVLQGAGISCGRDVYDVIAAGAEATGSSSGIANAKNPEAMMEEMIAAVRRAWDDRNKNSAEQTENSMEDLKEYETGKS